MDTDTLDTPNILEMELKHLLDPRRRLLLDKRFAIQHIGYKRWDIIARNAGPNRDIWYSLFEIGKGNDPNKITNINSMLCCGELIYSQTKRDLLPKSMFLPAHQTNNLTKSSKPIKTSSPTKTSKPSKSLKSTKPVKTKPLSKADQIRLNNITSKIKLEVNPIIEMINEEINFDIMDHRYVKKLFDLLESKYYEMIAVKMMAVAFKVSSILSKLKFVLHAEILMPEKMIKYQNFRDYLRNTIYDMIFGFNKYLCSKLPSNSAISASSVSDLKEWINHLKTLVDFDILSVINLKPELMFRTSCDNILDMDKYQMYPSQSQIFNFVTSNQNYLALVHTMLGSGKTTMVLPICGWYSELNRMGNNTKVIFCCPNEIVLLEVAHMSYNLGIPFGICIYNQHTNSIEYKWSSFVGDTHNRCPDHDSDYDVDLSKPHIPKNDAILYVCDMFATRHLLEYRRDCITKRESYFKEDVNSGKIPTVPDYVLIYDEPTKDADQTVNYNASVPFSLTTELFITNMKLAPPKVILMSATLPTYQQLPNFYDKITAQHQKMVVKSFAASESKIGCSLVTSTGEIIVPHSYCDTQGNQMNLCHVLDIIRTNPFIGRFYTVEVLLDLITKFKKHSLPIPNIEIIFTDPTKASQTTIQQFAYEMIQTMISINDPMMLTNVMKPITDSLPPLNLSAIMTSDLGRFKRGCIIYSMDPIETAMTIFKTNFDKIASNGNSSGNIFDTIKFQKIMEEYNDHLAIYKEEIERVQQKKNDSITKQNKETGKKDKLKEPAWITKAKITEEMCPVWRFPSYLQLGSVEHLKTFNCANPPDFFGSIVPEDIPNESNVSDEILIMLACGIGIYSTTHEELDDAYLKAVIMLAQKGLLKMIFSDSSIAYGTNLAVSDIIIFDEPTPKYNYRLRKYTGELIPSITDCHSMKTIFQMLGRAGRGGNLSFEAKVYTTSKDHNLANKLHKYVTGTLDEGSHDEIINIYTAFEVLWDHI